MRGNDLLMGIPDVMVTDTLTGNLLMKVFSSSPQAAITGPPGGATAPAWARATAASS